MQVILLEKVQNLGGLGETVKVKPGYARNFLIPSGKAVLATPGNLAEFEARRAELEKTQSDALGTAEARAKGLEAVSLTIARRAGDEGRLFGSVGTQDVADALVAQGIEVTRNEVRLPPEPIRQLGEYQVGLHFHTDIDASVTVNVIAEE